MELKERAIALFVKNPALTQDELWKALKCTRAEARELHRELAPKSVGNKEDLVETNEVTASTWKISLPRTRIHTLAQLLEYCEVDQNEWIVERFIVNKWEMGYIAGSHSTEKTDKNGVITKDKDNTAGTEALYQVKAFLRKKAAPDLDGYIEENTKLMQKVEKLNKELLRDRKYAKRLAEGHVGADELLKNVQEFVKGMGDFPSPVTPIKAQKPQAKPPVKEGHSEDAVLVISDTHFGDVIRAADTSGFPEFDLTIAGNRFGYIAKKAKMILGLHRAMYPIKRLYVPILGDIGNGDLHDAPKSNSLFIAPQIHFSYHMIRFMIEDLLTLVDEGIVEQIVLLFSVGNHMRMAEDKKMPTKLQAQRTFDWLIYQFVIEKFKDDPRVEIHQQMSPFIFENIRGHRYAFNHGMEVGYKNSPEAQAKSISSFINHTRALFDSPVYRAHADLKGATFDRFVIGDIHVPVSFPRLLSNGSLNGQNELGVNWGLEVIPAGQWLFGVSNKQIQTWQYFIDCTHVQRKPDDMNGYGEFAKEYEEKFGRL